jgi:predicted DNA-binding protein (UPF0251 family)/DNA-directed RNA polymerase subunit RPC12/RpoP
MPRPKNNRVVHEPPLFTEFKPIGIPVTELDQVLLSLDEFESLRLADYQGMSQEEAANEMEISRSTFSRLVEQARKKMVSFIFQGKLLTIDGGNVHFRYNIIRCQECGNMFKIDIDSPMMECPECHSKNLLNHAGGFGHGNCCRGKFKKGGNYARR